MGKVMTKSLTRMAHNMCIFENKERNGYYGIGGRFDKQQPDRWKSFGITEDKGLYLMQKDALDGNLWKLMNRGDPLLVKIHFQNIINRHLMILKYHVCIRIFQKYVLIVRNNVGKEQRFFSVLYSSDCLNWSEFHTPTLNPSYDPKSGDQYYSVIMHEIMPLKIILASALFYNENETIWN